MRYTDLVQLFPRGHIPLKLKDVYQLNGKCIFGMDSPCQDFSKHWFPGIVEVKEGLVEVKEDDLAQVGRLQAYLLESFYDSGNERGSSVTKLTFDGAPIALYADGGEHNDPRYLLVTDELRYLEAQQHVRQYLDSNEPGYEVVPADTECSLIQLFGFYHSELADRALKNVHETFGDAAASKLGPYDTLKKTPGYLCFWESLDRLIPSATPEQRKMILVQHAAQPDQPDQPAQYLCRGATLLVRHEQYTGPEVADWHSRLAEKHNYWLYKIIKTLPPGAELIRV